MLVKLLKSIIFQVNSFLGNFYIYIWRFFLVTLLTTSFFYCFRCFPSVFSAWCSQEKLHNLRHLFPQEGLKTLNLALLFKSRVLHKKRRNFRYEFVYKRVCECARDWVNVFVNWTHCDQSKGSEFESQLSIRAFFLDFFLVCHLSGKRILLL